MHPRKDDGSAGDADYGQIGSGYARFRLPEPKIAAVIHNALAHARTVLNVGAGAGSYEPTDRAVTPVEPSRAMRAQRPSHLSQAIDATAESLPFPDQHFDASMATFTVHQWQFLERGLAEMRRVTRGPVLVLSCDPSELDCFWLADYAPEVISIEARRYPPLASISAALGPNCEVSQVLIPLNCADGFNEAYYGRPEMLLDPAARLACSAWSFVEPPAVKRFETNLRHDLQDGKWDERHGHLRLQPEFEGSLRLVVSHP